MAAAAGDGSALGSGVGVPCVFEALSWGGSLMALRASEATCSATIKPVKTRPIVRLRPLTAPDNGVDDGEASNHSDHNGYCLEHGALILAAPCRCVALFSPFGRCPN